MFQVSMFQVSGFKGRDRWNFETLKLCNLKHIHTSTHQHINFSGPWRELQLSLGMDLIRRKHGPSRIDIKVTRTVLKT